MVEIVITFICVLMASALCSLCEAAILSLPLIRARILHQENKPNSRDLLYVKEEIGHTIASIVIVNNAINIIGSIYIGQMVADRYGDHWLGWTSAFLTLSIIFGGEIIPKTIGERFRVPIALFFAKPIHYLVFIFHPFVTLIMKITHPLVAKQRLPRVTEEEIKMMLKFARAEGTVETDEEMLCSRVFKLNDVRASQIMKPISRIYVLPADKTLNELKDEIINSRYSRIAVYEKEPINIVGIVQQRVLLREIAKDNYSSYIKEFMTKPIFVDWLTKADELLNKFQAYHQHLFIAQDGDGKNVGLVSMEDVLEELFGEIYDEKDVLNPTLVKKLIGDTPDSYKDNI